MPFMSSKVCKCCGTEKEIDAFRFRHESKRPDGYYVSICKACEKIKFQEYQKKNSEYFRIANRAAYLRKVGSLVRQSPINSDPEITKEKKRISVAKWQASNQDRVAQSRLKQKLNGNDNAKASRRRAAKKQATVHWDVEFTNFVCKEGMSLAKQRESLTGIKWHLDHIIPLQSDLVCGLHVWNNFQLLPARDNIRKSNRLEGGL